MSKNKMIMLPREVVEQAIEALFCTDSEEGSTAYENELEAVKKLRAALDRLQAEQDPAPNDATHMQPRQGAFYKRVDGKWYVWSLMKNGEPHRWYISPGTAESCLEPLAITPKQKRDPLTDERIWELYCDWHKKPGGCYGFARAIETHHGIK